MKKLIPLFGITLLTGCTVAWGPLNMQTDNEAVLRAKNGEKEISTVITTKDSSVLAKATAWFEKMAKGFME